MNRADVNRLFGIVLQLFAQVLHVGIDHPVIAGKIQSKGQFNEVFPGEYLLRIPGEGSQKLPLDGGKRNRFSLFADLLPVLVDHKWLTALCLFLVHVSDQKPRKL